MERILLPIFLPLGNPEDHLIEFFQLGLITLEIINKPIDLSFGVHVVVVGVCGRRTVPAYDVDCLAGLGLVF